MGFACAALFFVCLWQWFFLLLFACSVFVVWLPVAVAFPCLVAYGVGFSLIWILWALVFGSWPFLELLLVY
ncbi:hypothetical protein [Paraburkholderia caffeinilytica]|uniref:hypothetical protein n=1 Tax=Paraburkholderia caffeinilytica TaxID=1761016 RepID=UPI003DA15D23